MSCDGLPIGSVKLSDERGLYYVLGVQNLHDGVATDPARWAWWRSDREKCYGTTALPVEWQG